MQVLPFLKELKPYQPGKPIEELARELGIQSWSHEQIIKLASNENALGPSPLAIKAIVSKLDSIHRYPDALQFELKQKISRLFNLPPEYFVFANGSNELIEYLIRTFTEPGDQILMNQAGFVIYKIFAKICGLEVIEAPLKGYLSGPMMKNLSFDLDKMASLVSDKTRLIFIDNPSNPTGLWATHDQMGAFLDRIKTFNDCIVVLDQAYVDFADQPNYPNGIDLIQKYPNLVLMRTFSKSHGLAGLRLGYCIGHPDIIYYLHQIRPPFNVNILAQVAGVAAIDDKNHLQETLDLNKKMLGLYYQSFDKMGLSYVPSLTNFVMVDTKIPGKKIYEGLLGQGVIVRTLENYGLNNHLRINTGLEMESLRFLESLEKCIKSLS